MALELGAARYLRKPLTPDALLAAAKICSRSIVLPPRDSVSAVPIAVAAK